MASTNLTLSYLLQCRESISYLPHPWPYLPTNSKTLNNLAPLATKIPSTSTSTTNPIDSTIPTPQQEQYPHHPLSHPSLPPHTLFSQSALIYSTGIFASENYPPIGISKLSPIKPLSEPRASTAPQRAAGRRVEKWSLSRFEGNAEIGRGAMIWAADRFCNELGRKGFKEEDSRSSGEVEEIETHEV